MESQSDRELMKQVQAGDTAALALLFERHNVPLFRYLLQLSRNRALSEDLVQEVFFRVLKYANSYDPSFGFNVWLYRMARNSYFDAAQKRRGETWGGELDSMPNEEPIPDELVSRKQEISLLEKALKQLPEDKREILVLSRYHGLKYDDIGQILKCEPGTVKVRVYRALKELREKFCELQGQVAV